MSFETLVFRAHSPLTADHPVSAFSEVDVLDTGTGFIDAKYCGKFPAAPPTFTVLAFIRSSTSQHAENQEVILIPLRIGSDIVISTMASEMVEAEVPGNFLSAATAFWFLLSVS
jgi:hypothetical protein